MNRSTPQIMKHPVAQAARPVAEAVVTRPHGYRSPVAEAVVTARPVAEAVATLEPYVAEAAVSCFTATSRSCSSTACSSSADPTPVSRRAVDDANNIPPRI